MNNEPFQSARLLRVRPLFPLSLGCRPALDHQSGIPSVARKDAECRPAPRRLSRGMTVTGRSRAGRVLRRHAGPLCCVGDGRPAEPAASCRKTTSTTCGSAEDAARASLWHPRGGHRVRLQLFGRMYRRQPRGEPVRRYLTLYMVFST